MLIRLFLEKKRHSPRFAFYDGNKIFVFMNVFTCKIILLYFYEGKISLTTSKDRYFRKIPLKNYTVT